MILVTGSNGFVGKALCSRLHADGLPVRAAVRLSTVAGQIGVGQLDGNTDWSAALDGIVCVVHLAARVHVMDDPDGDPLAAYRQVNVAGSVNLARQAAARGVRRMVFVSSIKVNGEATGAHPFRADDTPAPVDPYGQSKLEAELALLALGRETGMEIVIVRPPLVYGPGVKANFLNLIKLVSKGIPLPLRSVRSRRSMVALANLVDLLKVCTTHPAAPGQVFLASDGVDLTIGELVGMIARAQGRRVWLVPVPLGLMRAGAALVGKSGIADRLLNSLQVDISKTRTTLEWRPVVLPKDAIFDTVAAFSSST